MKCEVCGGKEGGQVRLPAGDYVPRQLFQCPECKTIICNGCIRQETVMHHHAGNKKPLGLFARLLRGTTIPVTQPQCSICNAALDLEANRIAMKEASGV